MQWSQEQVICSLYTRHILDISLGFDFVSLFLAADCPLVICSSVTQLMQLKNGFQLTRCSTVQTQNYCLIVMPFLKSILESVPAQKNTFQSLLLAQALKHSQPTVQQIQAFRTVEMQKLSHFVSCLSSKFTQHGFVIHSCARAPMAFKTPIRI